MALSSTQVTEYTARIEKYKTNRDRLLTAFENSDLEVESFSLETGSGAQKVKFRSLDELTKKIDWFDKQIDYYTRLIDNLGVVSMTMDRWGG